MRKIKFALMVLAAVLIVMPLISSKTKFEGKIVMQATGSGAWGHGGGTSTLNYYVKGDKVRIDMHSARADASIIIDKPDEKMYMVMNAMKSYMEFPMKDMRNSGTESKNNEKIKKTGEMKKINGYNSEKWIITDDNGTSEVWMTKELGSFTAFSSPMGKQPKSSWQNEIKGSDEFPMLVIQKDKSGKETSRMEIRSVEKQNLDDSFFAVPAGYKEFKMPMGGRMPGQH